MNRREEIILVTLDLAAEKGLSNVTMSMIADRLGIKKPSLYNHFDSKDDIIGAMYRYLKAKAKEREFLSEVDYNKFVAGKSPEEALILAVSNYVKVISDGEMQAFYKVIYSERAINPSAAKIMLAETQRTILAAKNLFHAICRYQNYVIDDIDTSAASFAMTVRAMVDYKFDCIYSDCVYDGHMLEDFIKWFASRVFKKKDD